MNTLKKIYTFFNNKFLFDKKKTYPSIPEQKEYLRSFPEPEDEYDLSFFKYRCVCYYYYSIYHIIFLNCISFIALPFLFTLYRVKAMRYDSLMKQFVPNNLILCSQSAIVPNDDIFPEELKKMYMECQEYSRGEAKAFLLCEAQKIFFRALKKHFWNFHYLLVLLVRLSQQGYLIAIYKPKCITTYVCEREFSDPLLTKFSEMYGVHYVGHMHGDYAYQVYFAFMHLSQYWVWSKQYRDLFESLRCNVDMPIYCPKKHSRLVQARASESDYEYYCTYYLTDEKATSIYALKSVFDELKGKGKRCLVRPHPRFSDLHLIQKVFDKEMIENSHEISIESSLDKSYLTISTVSTVMASAYYSGKIVVIDDFTDPEAYKRALDSENPCIRYAHIKFSELLAGLKEDNNMMN